MSKSVKSIMRKIGGNQELGRGGERWWEREDSHEIHDLMTEDEIRHSRYRKRQKSLSELGPTSDRLPISEKKDQEDRPKGRPIRFEGPIEKLIEKYKDPEEVFKHLSFGQLMKYELKDGKIYEKGRLIYDGSRTNKPEA